MQQRRVFFCFVAELFAQFCAAGAYACSQRVEHAKRAVPVNACICDADPVFHFGSAFLVAGANVAFNHYSADEVASCSKLLCYTERNSGLLCPVLVAVAVGAVNHDSIGNTGFLLGLPGLLYMLFAVVRTFRGPAQNQVASLITLCGDDG